ncbi:MAG: DUF4062 domain-containing protein [Exiguobacterium profundum]|nr:MAG: DUF4062 domain-containing protein [Exiguobacterium profundum]
MALKRRSRGERVFEGSGVAVARCRESWEPNMNKKFQVFISSTYEDLIEERKSVEETIIRSGDIPVGMEAFPAADDEQFEFIKTIIDACDYYVLIIA